MAGSWHSLKVHPSVPVDTMLLLTDGSVMIHEYDTPNWHRLVPDAFSDYANGTWHHVTPLPANAPLSQNGPVDAPLYYASAVLKDGRVFVAGGEYNVDLSASVDLLAVQIYDPVADSWTSVPNPPGFANIGDAPTCVLPDGKVLLGNINSVETVILDPSTKTWAPGGNKDDSSSEETYTLLPDGTVLVAEVNNHPKAEKYVIANNNWVSAGSTPPGHDLVLNVPGVSIEIGPAILMTDGRVFATGASGHTALYTPPLNPVDPGSWAPGPNFPASGGKLMRAFNSPACLLPNGRVLCVVGPVITSGPDTGWAGLPIEFFEFDGVSLHPVPGPANAGTTVTFNCRLLLLPTGQVLLSTCTNLLELYTPAGGPHSGWKPQITETARHLTPGHEYKLNGRQLNGLSQAVCYGDDAQMATNYPLVRLEGLSGVGIHYCRTFDHSTMAVATGSAIHHTHFLVPTSVPYGHYQLVVVANGIPSDRSAFTSGPRSENTSTANVASEKNAAATANVTSIRSTIAITTTITRDLDMRSLASTGLIQYRATWGRRAIVVRLCSLPVPFTAGIFRLVLASLNSPIAICQPPLVLDYVMINRFTIRLLCAACILCISCGANSQQNLIVNSKFETGGTARMVSGWQPFWSRNEGAGSMAVEPGAGRTGGSALRVEHAGKEDWSVGQSAYIPVHSGEIFSISGWVKSDLQGDAEISVVTRDAAGKTLDWSYSGIAVGGKHDWVNYRRKLVAPDGCATLQYRLTGYGSSKLWFDSPSLTRAGSLSALTGRVDGAAERPVEFGNKTLHIQCNSVTGALSVTDTRSGLIWRQQPLFSDVLIVRAEKLDPRIVRLQALYLPSDGKLTITYTAAAEKPEIVAEVSGDCTLSNSVPFPHPFANQQSSSWLVIPMNEGVLYPVDDTTAPATRLIAYGGHGICMPWFGQITGKSPDAPNASGVMTLFNTPDDASVDIGRPGDGKLLLPRPLWDPSRGRLSYARKLTYLFTDGGGYVAQAKRYRQYAIETGLFKTLAQKRTENPNVDMLVGAVNVWAFGMDKLKLCSEMKSLGLDRVLWSGDGTPAEIDAINKLGYLTSRYDIYQDVWPPDAPSGLKKAGWPEDLVWLPNGDWMHGWADIQKHADGTQTVYQGGVISSPRGLKRAEEEIPADLKTHDYHCRFIDTTTASPFREDYNPAHPLSRSDDRRYKMALLDFCSKTEKLVVGTETGIDPSVPYVDYYEGMLSLGPFRLPDAGYDIMGYRKPTPDFLKFMVGPVYRIPLWELVYHDCVVAQWYWGDSSNKAPEVWDKRDLINILYATPPLFMMNKEIWTANKERFVTSYKAVCGVARQFGYDEMVSHHFLTADHTVQSTNWRSGSQIVVNMGDANHKLADGTTVKAGGWLVRNRPVAPK